MGHLALEWSESPPSRKVKTQMLMGKEIGAESKQQGLGLEG